MKKFVLLSIVSAALALTAGRAMATSSPTATNLVLSISGSATFNLTNYTTAAGIEYAKTTTKSFNNAQIYNLISNAVASAGNGLSNSLPANGYIVFNFSGYDAGNGDWPGLFYVTNKSGFYYQLSGYDGNNTYYSFIELDTTTPEYVMYNLGWYDYNDTDFDNTVSYTYNDRTGNGPVTSTSTALLYIHDNPYYYDDVDNPTDYIFNNNAIEIRGIFKATINYSKDYISTGSATLTGTGNIVTEHNGSGEVTSATATFSE